MLMIGGLLIGCAISGLLVGLVVMLASKLVLKESPEFSDAFKACFFAALVGAVVQFILGLSMADASEALTIGVSLLAAYSIYVILFQTILGYTMGQAIAVASVAVVVMLGLLFTIGLVIGLSGGAA